MYQYVLNRTIDSLPLIVTVLLIRTLFKRQPKWFNVCLYGLIGIKLLMPYIFKTYYSISLADEAASENLIFNTKPVNNPILEFPQRHTLRQHKHLEPTPHSPFPPLCVSAPTISFLKYHISLVHLSEGKGAILSLQKPSHHRKKNRLYS